MSVLRYFKIYFLVYVYVYVFFLLLCVGHAFYGLVEKTHTQTLAIIERLDLKHRMSKLVSMRLNMTLVKSLSVLTPHQMVIFNGLLQIIWLLHSNLTQLGPTRLIYHVLL